MDLFIREYFFKIILLLLVLSGCTTQSVYKAENYPLEPDLPESNTIKWAEATTPDGWIRVTNDGGATLGYSKNSAFS